MHWYERSFRGNRKGRTLALGPGAASNCEIDPERVHWRVPRVESRGKSALEANDV